MVNIAKLRGKMAEKGYTINKLAKEIGMNKATLYRKFAAEGDTFTIGEAGAIAETLALGATEAQEIFFAIGVA